MQVPRLYERLSKPSAPEIVEYYCKPHLQDDLKTFDIQMTIQKAHAVMLNEQKIVSLLDIQKILRALRELETKGPADMQLRPELNDLYTNTEAWLYQKIGPDVGGRLHTGRSRNDMFLTIGRMYVREQLDTLAEAVEDLIEALLQVAEHHLETVMPGYTHHSQHAQPITFAHFLLAHADAFFRDLNRMGNAYKNTNLSPMGGAAIATTGFPIDREMVASLLGFDGLVENSIDATGTRDFQLESGSSAAIAMSNLGRMTESLLLWNTFEFGMIRVPDEFCSISSIMPQKKNPVTLEILRAQSVLVAGYFSNMFGILKGIPTGGGREPCYVDHLMQLCFENSAPFLKLAGSLIRGIDVVTERMESLAALGYSTFTELADELVRMTGLSFGQSRRIVGRLVNIATQKGLTANQVTAEMLNETAQEITGEPLAVDAASLAKVLDPRYNVTVRDRTGGPAPSECRRMLDTRVSKLEEQRAVRRPRIEKRERAHAALNAKVDEILAKGI